MSFQPSPYQARVFDFVTNGQGSALVKAVAGAGKTTTIVKALELIPADKRVTFLAFNKKIATELQKRVPSHVKAATFHSVGFSAWRRFQDNVEIGEYKMRDLVKNNFAPMEVEAFGSTIQKLVSVAKSAGVGALVPDELTTWEALADHFDIQMPEIEEFRRRAFEAARKLLALSVAQAMQPRSVIDFDDMLYMPLLKDVPFYQNDWIFVDEAQDTNGVQLALLRRMLRPGGRLVAVGDEKQAIYGFRGADANAMANIREAFGCVELPLTISYRCAQSVVRAAQEIVPYLEASPSAPEGEVLHKSLSEFRLTNTDVVICRNTAPIVELAYQLIGKGVGCKVLGREIGRALSDVVKKMGGATLDEMLQKLDTFTEREVAKFTSKGQEQKAEAIKDRTDCIKAIAGNLLETERTIAAVLAQIDRMFSDSGEGLLTLCTAHKSKGLEWDRVFLFRPDLMPSKWARQQWQKDQEANLRYVAMTRAKRTLVFCNDNIPTADKQRVVLHPTSELPRAETARQKALRVAAEKNLPVHAFWADDV